MVVCISWRFLLRGSTVREMVRLALGYTKKRGIGGTKAFRCMMIYAIQDGEGYFSSKDTLVTLGYLNYTSSSSSSYPIILIFLLPVSMSEPSPRQKGLGEEDRDRIHSSPP
jgi:hypothetical protein